MQSRLITSPSPSIDVAASTRRSPDYPSFLLANSFALPAHWPNLEAYPVTASYTFEVPICGLFLPLLQLRGWHAGQMSFLRRRGSVGSLVGKVTGRRVGEVGDAAVAVLWVAKPVAPLERASVEDGIGTAPGWGGGGPSVWKLVGMVLVGGGGGGLETLPVGAGPAEAPVAGRSVVRVGVVCTNCSTTKHLVTANRKSI
ncbi:hypothetical protein KCU61_g288, partial [Aureobasidium melanogenum]